MSDTVDLALPAALAEVFANGSGPGEAFRCPSADTESNDEFRIIAESYAPGGGRSTAQIVADARAEFPGFSAFIESLCR
ncbi:hypothetical protein [Nocardia tengchongensis]